MSQLPADIMLDFIASTHPFFMCWSGACLALNFLCRSVCLLQYSFSSSAVTHYLFFMMSGFSSVPLYVILASWPTHTWQCHQSWGLHKWSSLDFCCLFDTELHLWLLLPLHDILPRHIYLSVSWNATPQNNNFFLWYLLVEQVEPCLSLYAISNFCKSFLDCNFIHNPTNIITNKP